MTTPRWSIAAGNAILVIALGTTHASGQAATTTSDPAASEADREAGLAAFRVGAQAYRANQFDVAARAFEEAYARDPRPETGFSLAQANRLQYYLDRVSWRVQRAVQLYQAYLEALPSGPRAKDAIDRLGELEPLLVELRSRGELTPYVAPVRTQLVVGAEVAEARVEIDGMPVDLWEPMDVSPGSHEIVVVAAGYERASRRVVVAAGRFLPIDVGLTPLPGRIAVATEDGSTVFVDGRRHAGSASEPITVEPGEHFVSVTRRGRRSWSGVVPVSRDQNVVVEAPLEPTGQRRVASWVMGSAGALAVAAGGAAGWAYAAHRDAARLDAARRALDATPADLARYNERVGDERDRRQLATGLAISAVALTLIGTGMWWFDQEAPGTAPRLDVTVTPDAATVTLGGTF